MDLVVYLGVIVIAAAVLMSARSTGRAVGDWRAERAASDRDPVRRWIAEEFVVTAVLGLVARGAFLVGSIIVAAYRLDLVEQAFARSWVNPFGIGVLFLFAINIWQEAAHLRLHELLRIGDRP